MISRLPVPTPFVISGGDPFIWTKTMNTSRARCGRCSFKKLFWDILVLYHQYIFSSVAGLIPPRLRPSFLSSSSTSVHFPSDIVDIFKSSSCLTSLVHHRHFSKEVARSARAKGTGVKMMHRPGIATVRSASGWGRDVRKTRIDKPAFWNAVSMAIVFTLSTGNLKSKDSDPPMMEPTQGRHTQAARTLGSLETILTTYQWAYTPTVLINRMVKMPRGRTVFLIRSALFGKNLLIKMPITMGVVTPSRDASSLLYGIWMSLPKINCPNVSSHSGIVPG